MRNKLLILGKKNKAFSLIELSIVILIIGILVAGVTQSSRLVRQVKLMSARSITLASPVPTIKNLIAWYESVGEKSFNENEMSEGSLLSNWLDNNIQSSTRLNGFQTADVNKPQYSFDESTNLPIVKFTDQDFFNLPDATVPFNNMPYTVFFVSQTYAYCACGLLGSGTYNSNFTANAFRYDGSTSMVNYWWGNDIYLPNSSTLRKLTIHTFVYDLTKREGFSDGVLKATLPASNRISTSFNNTIGKTFNTEFMNGTIGEIIIFDRALNTEERKSIESYLGKKWAIKVS